MLVILYINSVYLTFLLFYLFIMHNSFYPLYPPAEGVPLDFSLAPQALDISVIPDILILPSDMKHFVKVSDCPHYFIVLCTIHFT